MVRSLFERPEDPDVSQIKKPHAKRVGPLFIRPEDPNVSKITQPHTPSMEEEIN